MVDVVHEPMDDEQAEMHKWPTADFCGFGLVHEVSIQQIFEPCLLNANIVRWWNGQSSHIYQFSSTLTWIIVN